MQQRYGGSVEGRDQNGEKTGIKILPIFFNFGVWYAPPIAEIDGGLSRKNGEVQDDQVSDGIVLTSLGEAKETPELPAFDTSTVIGYKFVREYADQHMQDGTRLIDKYEQQYVFT